VAKAELVHQALKRNVDRFAWTTSDMLGVSPDIITHKFSIYKETCLITHKKRKLEKEKRLTAKEKAEKVLSVGFILEA